MYDELVKRLHQRIALTTAGSPLQDDLREAADAIENLIEVIQNHDFLENLIKPDWIPVTERLPKNEKDVLAYYGFKHDGILSDQRFIGTLCYFRFDPNPHWQHEGQGKLTVTHWMPLPEPPKEEARMTVTCTKCPCKGACDELPEDMSCEDVLAYYAIEPPKEEA